jgi:hypothetical protein
MYIDIQIHTHIVLPLFTLLLIIGKAPTIQGIRVTPATVQSEPVSPQEIIEPELSIRTGTLLYNTSQYAHREL